MKNSLQKAFGIAAAAAAAAALVLTPLALDLRSLSEVVPLAEAASFINTTVPSNAALTSGLQLFYSFDKTNVTATSITDESGNGKTGTLPAAPSVQYLVVAGGGGGGGGVSGTVYTAGGGGGEVIYNASTAVVVAQSYTVTVGGGGTGVDAPGGDPGGNGTDSVFSTITARGGKGGGTVTAGKGGKSGNTTYDGGINQSGTGAGGGGGDGQAGSNGILSAGGKGGDGTANSISGSSVYYGGAGGGRGSGTNGAGGAGGGGAGNSVGTANSGGGGGGSGSGGSGVVIVSYPTGSMSATGGTITTSGGNTIHTFNSSGTFKPTSSAVILRTLGRIGQAISFNGITASTTVGNVSSTVKSVAFWAKVATSTTQQNIIDLNGSGANIEIVSGTVTANGFTTPTIYVDGAVTSTLNDRNWHHVVVTTGTAVNASNVNLGVVGGNYYGGALDDLRMYNRALSASEVTRLYHLGATSYINTTVPSNSNLASGLVLQYSFDNTKVTSTSITDESGNGKSGALYSSAASVASTSVYSAGSSSITVPTGATTLYAKMWGAGGGGGSNGGSAATAGSGGGGGYASSSIAVTSGETLTVDVGGAGGGTSGCLTGTGGGSAGASGTGAGGAGGNAGATGCSGPGGGGGGGSFVKRSSTILIAAGGGGGGGGTEAGGGAGAGGAGGVNGSNGGGSSVGGTAGGSATSAGTAGTQPGIDASAGGGGGGGKLGGTGGGAPNVDSVGGAGGGGGTNYGGTTTSGSGTTPGNSSDADRGTAGNGGGAQTAGNAGLIKLIFPVVSASSPVTRTPGRIGQAISFNGITASTTVGNVSSTVKSVAFWAKVATSTTQQNIIDLNGSGANIEIVSGTVTANGFTTPTIYVDGAVTSTLNDRNWHHVVVTTGTNVNASNVNLGVVGGNYYGGALDDLRMYNRALSASEVTRLYHLGATSYINTTVPSNAVLKNGLVLQYSFDGTKFNVRTGAVTDESTSAANGTYTKTGNTTATSTPGRIGQAASFNGSTAYVNVPTISIPTDITVAAWVYSSNFNQNGMIVEKDNVNTSWELFFEGANLKWRGGGATSANASLPSNNTWHHLVATQSGTTATVYIDGTQAGTGTVEALGNGSGVLNVGRYGSSGGGYYFNGKIDDVRVYNRALSASEVTRLYGLGN